jgi:hypothetical protein
MCPNCNAPIRADSEFCTNCGTKVRPASPVADAPVTGPVPAREPAAPSGPAVPSSPSSSGPLATTQFRFDLDRLASADKIIGGASIVAFLSLFLPWFGVLGYSTSGISLHGYLVIAVLASLILIGYLLVRAGWDTPPVRLPIAHAPLLLIGTGVQLLFVLIGFLQSDGLGHEFGSYLALLSAFTAFAVIGVPVIRSVLAAQRDGMS